MLRKAIQNSRKRGQRVVWRDEEGNPVDLTTIVSIVARITNSNTGVTVSSDGTFTPQPPLSDGVFLWSYGTADLSTPGDYLVQFVGTDGAGLQVRSYEDTWTVLRAA